jgi:hypothetical protein
LDLAGFLLLRRCTDHMLDERSFRELQTNTLERISLVGHVTASDCSAREETICSD